MSNTDFRTMALTNLDRAADQLNRLPQGRVRTDELIAHSAIAQAVATTAVGQALLHLADVLAQTQPSATVGRTYNLGDPSSVHRDMAADPAGTRCDLAKTPAVWAAHARCCQLG